MDPLDIGTQRTTNFMTPLPQRARLPLRVQERVVEHLRKCAFPARHTL